MKPFSPQSPQARLLLSVALLAVVAALVIYTRRAHPPRGGESRASAAGTIENTRSAMAVAAPTSIAQSATAVTGAESRAAQIAHVHAQLRRYILRQTEDDASADAVMKDLLPTITAENAPALAQALEAQEIATPFGTAVLTRWLEADPSAAATWLAGHNQTTVEQGQQIAQALEKSPTKFDIACGLLPEGPWKQAMLEAAVLTKAETDPARAIALAQRLTPGAAQTSAYETIVYAWTLSDASAAVRWALSAEDPVLRQRLLAVGAKAAASSDPDLAATWLAAAAKENAFTKDTTLVVAESWAAKNALAAATWVASLPDATVRVPAMEVVVKRWMAADPAAANAWLVRQPDGPAILASLESEKKQATTSKD